MDIREKIVEIFKDKEFAKKAIKMSPEELCEVLKEKGIEVSIEEVIEAGKNINQLLTEDGEISIEALEAVTGGGKVGDVVAGIVFGVVIGIGALAVGMSLGW